MQFFLGKFYGGFQENGVYEVWGKNAHVEAEKFLEKFFTIAIFVYLQLPNIGQNFKIVLGLDSDDKG